MTAGLSIFSECVLYRNKVASELRMARQDWPLMIEQPQNM